jgi:hypothetical protein
MIRITKTKYKIIHETAKQRFMYEVHFDGPTKSGYKELFQSAKKALGEPGKRWNWFKNPHSNIVQFYFSLQSDAMLLRLKLGY